MGEKTIYTYTYTVVWNALKLEGKKLRLKNILLLPSKYNGKYLQKVMPLENVNK